MDNIHSSIVGLIDDGWLAGDDEVDKKEWKHRYD
jgi:hypothetical protein